MFSTDFLSLFLPSVLLTELVYFYQPYQSISIDFFFNWPYQSICIDFIIQFFIRYIRLFWDFTFLV